MGFSELVPVYKVKSGGFKISNLQMRKTAPWTLQISMSHPEFTGAFGQAEQFSILIGNGEKDKGKLQIKASPDGKFRPVLMKHCVIFRLPPTEWTFQDQNFHEEPVRRQTGQGEMVIDLPEWAYDPTAQRNLILARKAARGK